MKILLDECVTIKLKESFGAYDCYTVSDMGWNGLKNGKLMSKCEEENFVISITIDKNLIFQQNIPALQISIVVFDSSTSKKKELEKFIPKFKERLNTFEKGKYYVLNL